jgi:hypothetical protein
MINKYQSTLRSCGKYFAYKYVILESLCRYFKISSEQITSQQMLSLKTYVVLGLLVLANILIQVVLTADNSSESTSESKEN